VRVEDGLEIAAVFSGFGFGEEPAVEAEFCINGVGGKDPVVAADDRGVSSDSALRAEVRPSVLPSRSGCWPISTISPIFAKRLWMVAGQSRAFPLPRSFL